MRTLSDLERDAQRNRTQLAATVGELHDRLDPTAVKADVKEYLQDRTQQIYRGVERSARENPVRAVAIAAGLAYPLWRIVSSVPVPILLIGAGLALTKKSSGGSNVVAAKVGEVTSRLQTGIADQTAALKEKVGNASDAMMRTAHDVRDQISDTAQRAGAAVSAGAERLTSEASKLTSQASEFASDTARRGSDLLANVRGAGSDAISSVADQVSSTSRAGTGSASYAVDKATEMAARSQDRLIDTIEKHPLVVGALGLIIGAVVAGALPTTRIENRAFGAGADGIKSKAGDLVSQGVQSVKSEAGQVYDEVKQAAEQHGLTADGLQNTANDVVEKVSSAAKRSMSGGPSSA